MWQRIIYARWGNYNKQRLQFMCKKLLGGVMLKAFLPCYYYQIQFLKMMHINELNVMTCRTMTTLLSSTNKHRMEDGARGPSRQISFFFIILFSSYFSQVTLENDLIRDFCLCTTVMCVFRPAAVFPTNSHFWQ